MTGTELRFFAEYECYPLWVGKPDGGEDNLDPTGLGIDADLAQAIVTWSDDYDALFDPSDFGRPLFDDPQAETAFADRGRELATRLAAALGDRYSVRYSWNPGDWVQLS
jgi:hypothetical protein